MSERIEGGTLYIVSTPIGNLADISLRALTVLREVDIVAAEDTRTTHNLLQHYGIETPTTPYHQHSMARKTDKLLELLKSGKSVAVVSDAGTPGISDPGYELIGAAIANDVRVVGIPGANAAVYSLVVSGLPTRRFAFEGFPSRSPRERRSQFADLAREPRTMVFYESPHRVLAALKDMLAAWGDRPVAVVREATKKFEEVHRGTLSTAIRRFAEVSPRGEFTLVVAGSEPSEEPAEQDERRIEDAVEELVTSGVPSKEAAKQLAERFGMPKRDAYQLVLEHSKGTAE